jgi:hypothetical protein
MEHRERILIGCPRYKAYVTGSYECDEQGRYLLKPDGTFDLRRARCGQLGGKCNETLCYFHRYNKQGKGTWYPTDILAGRSASNNPTPDPAPDQFDKNDLF